MDPKSETTLRRLDEIWMQGRRRTKPALPSKPSTSSILRPKSWARFVGHDDAKRLLLTSAEAAKLRGEQMSSVLLWGPPGCGKTSLAHLVGGEFESRVISINGAGLQVDQLVSTIIENRHCVLIVDEIHCLPTDAQDCLLTVLDENEVWQSGQAIPTEVVVVGTTTDLGAVSSPLRSRFRHEIWIGLYSVTELTLIANQAAAWLGLNLPLKAARIVAGCARGVPRLALRIVYRYRDLFTIDPGEPPVDLAQQAIRDLGYDDLGLLPQERNYLHTLWRLGGRTGLANIASALSLREQETKLLEPYLLKMGFVTIESRGRALTLDGLELFL